VLGSRSGYGLRRLMSGPVDDPLWLDFDWELSANSDHWSFIEKRIPVVLLHTGLHRDYHRPSDDAERINREGLRAVSRYLLGVLMKVANEEQLPKFRDQVRRESDRTQREVERPLPRATLRNWPSGVKRPQLGISWRPDEAEPGTVFLTRVVEGTPAAAAGLQVRDRIYEVGGRSFADEKAFQTTILAMLNDHSPTIELLIERRGQLRNVVVSLPAANAVQQ
jgi:C-terminal processing protease CtpA/Prc